MFFFSPLQCRTLHPDADRGLNSGGNQTNKKKKYTKKLLCLKPCKMLANENEIQKRCLRVLRLKLGKTNRGRAVDLSVPPSH